MTELLTLIIGLFLGALLTALYLTKRYKSISHLLEDKLLINDLLKLQIKNLQAKKSKKYYRRKSYNKSSK
tara:strand:- start:192 stop:401 length:210 start_codon:yes stop_codon:yes gene_type:complete